MYQFRDCLTLSFDAPLSLSWVSEDLDITTVFLLLLLLLCKVLSLSITVRISEKVEYSGMLIFSQLFVSFYAVNRNRKYLFVQKTQQNKTFSTETIQYIKFKSAGKNKVIKYILYSIKIKDSC